LVDSKDGTLVRVTRADLAEGWNIIAVTVSLPEIRTKFDAQVTGNAQRVSESS
jgi:hypothetical protein